MAITYNVCPCKGGFGIYVRALSGDELKALAYRLPEIDVTAYKGAVPVLSDRITRKKTERQAKQALKRIKQRPIAEQIELISKRYIRPTDKDFKLVKLQYTRFNWSLGDKWVSPFTTQDNVRAERMAMDYAAMGTRVKLTKTVAKNRKLTESEAKKVAERGEIKVEKAKGLKGMCLPLADQKADQFLNRIGSRRRKTTTAAFYAKYR